MNNKLILTSVLGLALVPATAHAQFSIDWYTIDSGGGASAGGAFSLIGTIGQPDAAPSSGGPFQCGGGFWGTPPTSGGACYANCDNSSGSPLLTPNDFACFLNAYANSQSYANCDSTGGLTPNDFQCFLNAFANGCP
jgi:hypothetical protein